MPHVSPLPNHNMSSRHMHIFFYIYLVGYAIPSFGSFEIGSVLLLGEPGISSGGWQLWRAAVLHLATTCRDRLRVPPVPPEAFGDVVGDQLSPSGVGTYLELPTRSQDLPFGTWGVVNSVGGAVLGSYLSDSFSSYF